MPTRQSSREHTAAAPLTAQFEASCCWPTGRGMSVMKLLDCPVVERIPALSRVLYSGHMNRPKRRSLAIELRAW